MAEETKVFESELEGGIQYEVHVSQGFSGRSEIALKVEGEVISVVSAEVKRSGNIFCRTTKSKAGIIKKERQDISGTSPLSLSDVMSSGNDDEEDLEIEIENMMDKEKLDG